MIRRFFWLVVGIGIGAGGSFWANRRVRRVIDRYAPEEIRARVENRVRSMGEEVRSAVAEGRDAMREREAQLGARPRRNRRSPWDPRVTDAREEALRERASLGSLGHYRHGL
ncbi:MAG TPA: hypothetical protein ENI86_12980 [Acidimicrobiales bacterium]|nr:hypothetical protein [Acidimicrobiales bacterium]